MESEWREVKRKKDRKSGSGERVAETRRNRRSFREDIFEGKTSTFYLTKFSDTCSEADLWRVFQKIGKVVDVYVARKRDRLGERFGFARFLGITDFEGFERKLRNTWIGDGRIHANVAKFGRANPISKEEHTGKQENVHSRSRTLREQKEPVSYAEAVKQSLKPHHSPIKIKDKLFSSEESKSWMNKVLIGRVASFNMLWNLESLKDAQGCQEIKIRYLGGLFVMLEFGEERLASSFLQEAEDCWRSWFITMDRWSLDFRIEDRLASILIQGVPPHAWSSYMFTKIAWKFGDIIIDEECAVENRNMSIGRVGILTKRPPGINDVVNVTIDEREFTIYVVEDFVESTRLIPFIASSEVSSGVSLYSDDDQGFSDNSEYGQDDTSDAGGNLDKYDAWIGVEDLGRKNSAIDKDGVVGDTFRPSESHSQALGNLGKQNVSVEGGGKSGSLENEAHNESTATPNPQDEEVLISSFSKEDANKGKCLSPRKVGHEPHGLMDSHSEPININVSLEPISNEIGEPIFLSSAERRPSMNVEPNISFMNEPDALQVPASEAQNKSTAANGQRIRKQVKGNSNLGNFGRFYSSIEKRHSRKNKKLGRSIDLNKEVSRSSSSQSGSSSHSGSCRNDSSSGGGTHSTSSGGLSEEVRDTMEIGNLIGFDMQSC